MEIKRVNIGGNREEIDRRTGEHTPNFIDSVKRSDLIFTPEKLIRKFFRGGDQEYNNWLKRHKLEPSEVNYHDINQKQELINRLRIYTMKLLEEAKSDSMFSNELGNIIVTKWLESFDTLENHIYDLSDFDKIEFIKISEGFKESFTTNSPFAFLTIDEANQQIKVVESHKVLLLLDKRLPMGNKRGTPVGQTPQKLYQNFFTTIGYKGKGELTEGLNHHRLNFKNFNFNLNIEIRLLNDIIYDRLQYNKEQIQVAFIFGAYGKKLYFESDIKGTERTEEELKALSIAEGATSSITRELHKERQGTIAVDQTVVEVKKRVEHPKVENIIKPKPIVEPKQQEEPNRATISTTLEDLEKEISIRQQGYAQLAKEKISEALINREQYISEFYSFLEKGMSITDALNKFSERYANNPYIKGIIETSITGELQLQALKDRGIEELNRYIDLQTKENKELKRDLDTKETEIASLNQNIESLVVAHTKQLEKIEVKIERLVEERGELIKRGSRDSEMIIELERLIVEYEKALKDRDIEIDELKEKNTNIDKKNREIENYESDIRYYTRQIEQLKEENRLILSATNLLKISNQQLESQLENLTKKNREVDNGTSREV